MEVTNITQPKKRGRPPKDKTETQSNSIVKDENKKEYNFTSEVFNKLDGYLPLAFKKNDGNTRIIDKRIQTYTTEMLSLYISDPTRYVSQLIDVNNYMYNTSGFFQRLIDYYVKMVLYRWDYTTEVKNVSFLTVNRKQIQKNFIAFGNRINQLNIEQELHEILIKMFLEDAVYGYWLEDGDTSVLYYLPSTWCVIRSEINGLWSYHIDTKKISNTDLEKLPKELQSLIRKYNSKSGEESLAPVPFEKGLVLKWNNHYNYIYPPFSSVLINILLINKYKTLDQAKTELDSWTLLSMEIPTDVKNLDSLMLSEDVVRQFVIGAQGIVPDQVGIIPTPMPMKSIEMNKSVTVEKDKVKEAIDQYNRESGVPSSILGDSTSGSELAMSIKNDSTTVFTILNQLSNVINLKLKIEGFDYPSYFFKYTILPITVFNEEEYQDRQLKNANAGSVNKFRWMASQGYSPNAVIGQNYIENDLFKDMFDGFTTLQSAYTRKGNLESEAEGGRPKVSDDKLTDGGTQSREDDTNNKDSRV